MNAARAEGEELAVEERLAASGRAELWPLLERLSGYELPDAWTLGGPIGVGARSLVVAARGPAGEAAVKLPLLDHHRPWTFGSAEIEAARGALAREAVTLERLAPAIGILPRFHALYWAPNPLTAGRASGADPFLVMERVHGPTLGQALARSGDRDRVELMARAAQTVLAAFAALSMHGGHYTDLKPEHLVVAAAGPRLLDAGSIWLPGHPSLASTPAYSTPRGDAAGDAAARTARAALVATLYEAWTGRSPSTRASEPAEWQAAPCWLGGLVDSLERDGVTWADLAGGLP